MKDLKEYITESWKGVKKQTNNANIESWCEEMGIKNYTINSQGEIDVDGYVNLSRKDFKELPYKFGEVSGFFDLSFNQNLISLKNCPNEVEGHFSCSKCPQLDSLDGCPKEIKTKFFCSKCKREFTTEEVTSLCNVKKTNIYV